MTDFLKDLRHAMRLLARKPGISALAVLSLGLGIGVNTSIFSIVHAVLAPDLPMVRPSEVLNIYTSDSEGDFLYSPSSYPDYVDLRDQNEVFSELVAFNNTLATWDDGEQTKLIFGQEVSGNYFDFLGLQPVLGRAFLPEEDRTPGSHPVVILSHRFYRQKLGGDPAVLGETLDLNGIPFTIIGVGPEQLKGGMPIFSADYWIPMMMKDAMGDKPRLENRDSHSMFLQGRLRPGVTVEQAQAQLTILAGRLAVAYPESNEGRKLTAIPAEDVTLHPAADGPAYATAGLLMGMVALVLLIACSNIANLLLARAADRRREIAIRMALGSSRGRLIRQLLSEGLVLGVMGAGLGLLFARWTTQLLVSFQPPMPIELGLDLGIDGTVLAFTLGLGLLTGLLCGLAPALQASRPDLVPTLKDESPGRSHHRFGLRNILVVAQVTISTVLLIGAGLFLRSLGNAQSIDPGFDLRQGVVAQLFPGLGSRYTGEEARVFFDQLVDNVRALPGVRSAALGEFLPLGLTANTGGLYVEGQDLPQDEDPPEVDTMAVGPGYFETMGIQLIQGREASVHDTATAPGVMIVNETAARRFWPGEEPLGKRLRFDDEGPWSEVVGVARDGKYRTLGEEPRPYVYSVYAQEYTSMMSIVVATAVDEQQMLPQLRAEIEALDPGMPIFDLRTLSDLLAIMLFPARMGAVLLTAFGVLGLVLASVGLYGVVAYSVSQRTREVGIRMAIGADRADVVRLVVGEGMVLVGIGLGLGVGLALLGTKLLESLLYGVSTRDPVTFGLVAVVLVLVAFLANLMPAWRATRIEPVAALRYE